VSSVKLLANNRFRLSEKETFDHHRRSTQGEEAQRKGDGSQVYHGQIVEAGIGYNDRHLVSGSNFRCQKKPSDRDVKDTNDNHPNVIITYVRTYVRTRALAF
jgi:hypothetical protein